MNNKRKRNIRRCESIAQPLLYLCILLLFTALYTLLICTYSKKENDSGIYTDNETIALATSSISYAKNAKLPDSIFLNVRSLCQYPELPTGCEATAAVMALEYAGASVYLEDFAGFIPCEDLIENNGLLYGPDPNICFIGSPFRKDASYGCFEDVIINTINANYPGYYAEKVEGTLNDFCNFIYEDTPVVIWVTMEMQEIINSSAWEMPNGEIYYWPGREHCMLLVGYDENYFYFNDPRTGGTELYDRALSEERYEEMGSRALIIKSDD